MAATLSPYPSPPPPQAAQPPPANPKPICTWTHHETINLIQVYQDKWYCLKRGQLKSTQWEEIAVTSAVKCGYDDDYSHPSAKSAIQCRHKMEKLRRRYKTEKQSGSTTRWPYFHLMECLENGSTPIPARPMAQLRPSSYEDDNGNEKEEEEDESYSKSRSINYILWRPTYVNRFSSSGVGLKRARSVVVEDEEERREGGMGTEMVAAEVRRFAERMVTMEKRKMETVKEIEKWRMQMENRKIQMILESQSKIVDMIFNDDDDELYQDLGSISRNTDLISRNNLF